MRRLRPARRRDADEGVVDATRPIPTTAPLLQMRGVTRSVPLPNQETLHILRGIDLDVWPGDHVAIVGRSGSGKTTLMNLLGLIDRQSTGDLLLDDQDVVRMRDGRRARLRGRTVGFVFQQFNLLPGRSALENVMMPMLYGDTGQFLRRRRAALEMLDRVGLADRADQVPNRLSGGEQQRVAVARALVRRPRLILADEPTGALDVTTGEAVMGLLDEIARESDAALITITHDLQVAALSDRTYLLDGGVLHAVDVEEAGAALAATSGIRARRAAVASASSGPPTARLGTATATGPARRDVDDGTPPDGAHPGDASTDAFDEIFGDRREEQR